MSLYCAGQETTLLIVARKTQRPMGLRYGSNPAPWSGATAWVCCFPAVDAGAPRGGSLDQRCPEACGSPAVRAQSRPLRDSSTATGRVPGNSENTMVMMAVIGTARKAPGMPHSSDHTARLMRMAKGLRFSELPIT